MLLCKQEEAGIQLNAEQADWKDDTDDESDDQELKAYYMYMAKIQQVSSDTVDSGPIFDTEPEQKIDQNDEDADLAKERELLASLIEKLKCEIDETKNRNTLLETSNKVLVEKLKSEIEDFKNKNKSLTEANNKLSKENDLLYADFKKSKAELKRCDSIEYASEMELACAKVREMKNKLSAHQDTISILKQQKDAQIKLYKSREDKKLEKFIDLENKVKFAKLMLNFGVTHRLATPYHPQTSGQVQRIHDSKIKYRVFNVGDRVLLFNSRLEIFSGKLKTRWSGPFTITQVFPYGIVELSETNGLNFKVNGYKLKHYFEEDIPKMVVLNLQTFPKDQ
nr:reverse transcriptase domain-containing protein [Tanacetum cinerariifolium]